MDTQVARERLLELRRELEGTIEGLTEGAEGGAAPERPEGGQDFSDVGARGQQAAEHEAVLQAARTRLESVDEALGRLEAGTYGISVVSGEPIPEERLEARPDAATLAGEEL